MLLQVRLLSMVLWQESIRRKEHHLPEGDTFHRRHEFQPIIFGQMFNNIQSDTSVKLSRLKIALQMSNVAQDQLVVSLVFFGRFQAGSVALDPDETIEP